MIATTIASDVRYEIPTGLEKGVLRHCLKIRDRILACVNEGMPINYAGRDFYERKKQDIMVLLVKDLRDAAVRHLYECQAIYSDWQSRERICRVWEEHLKAQESVIEDCLHCWRHNHQTMINLHKKKRKRTWLNHPALS